jgi:hypothetical protein
VAHFKTPRKRDFFTTFTTRFTTTSPQKHHRDPPLFLKHPSKTAHKTTKKPQTAP